MIEMYDAIPSRWMKLSYIVPAILFLISTRAVLRAEVEEERSHEAIKAMEQRIEDMDQRLDTLQKTIDDILWYDKVGDVALIDKVYHVGPPPANVKNPTAMGARNPVKFWSYIFMPKNLDPAKKYPLIVLPHGGVHANFDTYHTHIIREMMAQGYIVIAPEYRGSSGYGETLYKEIDYGGLEDDDVHAARDYMIENCSFIDPTRIGIVGWSHGGLIALMNIFQYPKDYQVAFAGNPVSDLVARLGYQSSEYPGEFSADYHIGKTVNEDVNEYRRRSPVFHAKELQTPLLIHTNTNDDDVYELEVQNLINALKAEGKKFEYEVFQDAPGGHSFDRIDTMAAKRIRLKIYVFLGQYLHPPRPFTSQADLEKAGYRF